MNDCQASLMNYVTRAKTYLESLVSQEHLTLENEADKGKTGSNQTSMVGIPSMQSVGDVVFRQQLSNETETLLIMLGK